MLAETQEEQLERIRQAWAEFGQRVVAALDAFAARPDVQRMLEAWRALQGYQRQEMQSQYGRNLMRYSRSFPMWGGRGAQ